MVFGGGHRLQMTDSYIKMKEESDDESLWVEPVRRIPRMLRKASLVSLSLTLVVIAGCAEPPTQQIQEAEKALKDAQESGAATYSADEYAKLEGTLAALRKEVADQDEKFTLFRDYGKAQHTSGREHSQASTGAGPTDPLRT